MIGCGWQAESQVECMRAALPQIERVVAYCRDEQARAGFCKRFGAEEAEWYSRRGRAEIVVTVTNSRDPVLRGEWLKPGALVCAVGANRITRASSTTLVLERASFVCCDSREQAKIEAGDLVEPVERGVLDWLEVHELHGGRLRRAAPAARATTTSSSSRASASQPRTSPSASSCYDRARERGSGVEV